MKKKFTRISIIALFMALGSLMSNAQTVSEPSCFNSLTGMFGPRASTNPQVLNRLGAAPQYGKVPLHTSESLYSHLKRVYNRNSRNRRSELDRTLRAIGYSGFNDPNFNVSKITAVNVPAGTTGWMGAYSRGHKYAWSQLGKDFEGYTISSADGECSIYMMKICGNSFYVPTDWVPQVVVPEVTCKTQTIMVAGSNSIKGGSVVNTTLELPVVANYNNGIVNTALCLGTQTVPVRMTYDLAVSGESAYTRTIQVCDRGDNGVMDKMNVAMPINLDYDITNTEVAVDGGHINMEINQNQYKALSKVFSVCPADMTFSTASTTNNTMTNDDMASNMTDNMSAMDKVSSDNCKKQTINFVGSASSEEKSVKAATQEVTVIGYYNSVAPLKLGEKSSKYLCLGSYSVPANAIYDYNIKGDAKVSKVVEICDDGTQKDIDNITVPVNLTHSFTKQDLMIGDYGKIYVPLTETQYKSLSKKFGRCCDNASLDVKCN